MPMAILSLAGNVGQDPEIRGVGQGREVISFTMANNYKRQNEECTDWYRVVCFYEGLIGLIEKRVRKGSHVTVVGELQMQKWTNRDNVEQTTPEINIYKIDFGTSPVDDRRDRGDRDRDRGGRDDYDRARPAGREDRGNGRDERGYGRDERGSGRDRDERGGRDDRRAASRPDDRGGARAAGRDERGGGRERGRDDRDDRNGRAGGNGGNGQRYDSDLDDQVPF